MNCPPDIADCVLDILKFSILNIRAHPGDARYCDAEANHVHNLPGLLKSYRPEQLRYYLEVERPQYMSEIPEEKRRVFAPPWKKLDAIWAASYETR